MKNEPAFPTVSYVKPVEQGVSVMTITGGMDLRDYFAGQALVGICGNADCSAPTYKNSDHELISRTAYSLADAMLKERVK
jgi:hypothetical protein